MFWIKPKGNTPSSRVNKISFEHEVSFYFAKSCVCYEHIFYRKYQNGINQKMMGTYECDKLILLILTSSQKGKY